MRVTEMVFFISCLTMLGWFLFVIYGGVGLSALPLGFIRSYYGRPQIRSPNALKKAGAEIKAHTQELLELSNEVTTAREEAVDAVGFWNKRKSKKQLAALAKKLRTGHDTLKEVFEVYEFEKDMENTNPLWFIGSCWLGMLMLVVSMLWIAHM